MPEELPAVNTQSLNQWFASGDILKQSRQTLDRCIVFLANERRKDEKRNEVDDGRSLAIRHILNAMLTEEINGRTFKLAFAAFVISILSLGVASTKLVSDVVATRKAVFQSTQEKELVQKALRFTTPTPSVKIESRNP